MRNHFSFLLYVTLTLQVLLPGLLSANDPTFKEVKKLLASDAESEDELGFSVAISGDTIVVGALGGDSGTKLGVGAAYVFERHKGGLDNWEQVTKLIGTEPGIQDLFGDSVAISGDTIVVGAPGSNSSSTGEAYVFERNQGGVESWGQVKKIVGLQGSHFGASVAINGDVLVVGANWKNFSQTPGEAYIFERNQGGLGNWGEVAKLKSPAVQIRDHFGEAVSISGDTIVIGAPDDDHAVADTGAAYVFERNEGGTDNWGQVTKLTAPDPAIGDDFGRAVAISEDTIVVGVRFDDDAGSNSGSAHIFGRNQGTPGNWGHVTKLVASDAEADDRFGVSVAIKGDSIVVGAFRDDNVGNGSGAAYVFGASENGPSSWEEISKLTPSDAATADYFGFSVAIDGHSMLGNTIAIGALNDDDACPTSITCDSGSAYVFQTTRADLFVTQTDSTNFVAAGNQLDYTVTVQNLGPDDAHDVIVTETLPPEVSLVETSGCAEDPAAVPTCTLDLIADGSFADYTVTVATDPAFLGGLITHHVTATSSTFEANPGDESASEETIVFVASDVSVTLSASPDPVMVGEELVYLARVSNLGPSHATAVTLTDTLKAGASFVSASPPGVCSEAGGTVTCEIGDLEAGATFPAVVEIRVLVEEPGTIINSVGVSGAEADPSPLNNSAHSHVEAVEMYESFFTDGFESGDTTAWSG